MTVRITHSLFALGIIVLTATSCSPLSGTPATADATIFRIENATASAVRTAITITDVAGEPIDLSNTAEPLDIPVVTITPGEVTYSTLETVGAVVTVGTGASLPTEAEVRVPGYSVSEGRLACGPAVQVVITVDGADATVLLAGDGSGTPHFDSGSVGEDGKRYLILGRDFRCGEAVVLRVDRDGTSAGSDSASATGRVAVVTAGMDSPFDEIVNPGTGQTGGDDGGTDGGDGGTPSEPDPVIVRLTNTTNDFIRLSVQSGAGSLGRETNVFVPPLGESAGEVDCADSYTLTGYSLTTTALTGLVEQVLTVLTGAGTGATDFDSGSIGQQGQRVLQASVHFNCGDSIEVNITDAGHAGFTEPNILDDNGEIVGFEDVNSNSIQDAVPDQLGAGTVSVN
jgi:hypothetical protein